MEFMIDKLSGSSGEPASTGSDDVNSIIGRKIQKPFTYTHRDVILYALGSKDLHCTLYCMDDSMAAGVRLHASVLISAV